VTVVARLALRGLLRVIGALLRATSAVDPVLRSCITRDVVVEISTADGVARHFRFDGGRRRASSHPGRTEHPDASLRFKDAALALRVLGGDEAAAAAAIAAGDMQIEGAAVALWFSGLVKRLLKIGRWSLARKPLPHPYVRHDPNSRAARFITVEPPQRTLDPAWEAAWRQRAKLAAVRVPAGEPPDPF
jgi:hypothetical protein